MKSNDLDRLAKLWTEAEEAEEAARKLQALGLFT